MKVAFVLTTAAVLAAPLWHAVPLLWQVVVLAAGVAVIGVPHGGLDGEVGRRLLRRQFGRRWWVPFVVGYLATAGTVVVAFYLVPTFMLVAFLAASALHFGTGDADGRLWPGRTQPAAGWVTGATLLALISRASPVEVAGLYAVVAAGSSATTPDAVRTWSSAALAVLAVPAAAMWLRHAAGGSRGDRRHGWTAAELAVVWSAAVFCPPLVAFGLYFCLWHGPRHVLGWFAEGTGDRDLREFVRQAWPATLATFVLMGVGWLAVSRTGPPTPAAVQVLFVSLAALTFPHMALEFAWRRLRTGARWRHGAFQ